MEESKWADFSAALQSPKIESGLRHYGEALVDADFDLDTTTIPCQVRLKDGSVPPYAGELGSRIGLVAILAPVLSAFAGIVSDPNVVSLTPSGPGGDMHN